jgi:hypothetical protein
VNLQNILSPFGFATSMQVKAQMWGQTVQSVSRTNVHLHVCIEFYVISALCFGVIIMSEFLSVAMPSMYNSV